MNEKAANEGDYITFNELKKHDTIEVTKENPLY